MTNEETKTRIRKWVRNTMHWTIRGLVLLVSLFVLYFLYHTLSEALSKDTAKGLALWLTIAGLGIIFVPLLIYALYQLAKKTGKAARQTGQTIRRRPSLLKYFLFVALLVLFVLLIPAFIEMCRVYKENEAEKVAAVEKESNYTMCIGHPGRPGVTDFFNLPPLDLFGGCYGTLGSISDGNEVRYSYKTNRMNASRPDEGVFHFTCEEEREACTFKYNSTTQKCGYTSGSGQIEFYRYSYAEGEWRGTYLNETSDGCRDLVGLRGRIVFRPKPGE